MFGIGISFASFRRFWAVAARRNSSRAPFGPRSRNRSSLRIRLRWANNISTFLRSRREVRPSQDLAICRAISRAPSWMELGTLRAGVFGQHLELESASRAVVFAGAVEHRRIVIHQSARGGQLLAAWAEVEVVRVVIGEVVT